MQATVNRRLRRARNRARAAEIPATAIRAANDVAITLRAVCDRVEQIETAILEAQDITQHLSHMQEDYHASQHFDATADAAGDWLALHDWQADENRARYCDDRRLDNMRLHRPPIVTAQSVTVEHPASGERISLVIQKEATDKPPTPSEEYPATDYAIRRY